MANTGYTTYNLYVPSNEVVTLSHDRQRQRQEIQKERERARERDQEIEKMTTTTTKVSDKSFLANVYYRLN